MYSILNTRSDRFKTVNFTGQFRSDGRLGLVAVNGDIRRRSSSICMYYSFQTVFSQKVTALS